MTLRSKLRLGALGLLALAAAAFGLFRWNLSRRVDRAIEAIRAQGYPVTLEELDAWYAEPPAGENAAEVMLDALACSVPLPTELGEAIEELGRGKLVGRRDPFPQDVRRLMVAYTAGNKTAFDLVYKASAMTRARWPIECGDGYAVNLPHHILIRNCCLLLQMQALLDAEDGGADGAFRALRAAFDLADTLAEEPVLDSQSKRAGILAENVAGLERVLNRAAFTEQDLAALDAKLKEAERAEPMIRGLAGERCMTIAVACSPEYAELAAAGNRPWRGGWPEPKWPDLLILMAYRCSGLSDHDLLTYLVGIEATLDALPAAAPKRLAQLPASTVHFPRRVGIMRITLYRVAGHTSLFEGSAAYLRAARLALAVERYRLAHRELPDTADALVPDFIGALPLDPYSDGPIRYKRLPDGFVTYSLASNRQDDGGVESADWGKAWREGDLTFTVERRADLEHIDAGEAIEVTGQDGFSLVVRSRRETEDAG